MKFNLNSMMKPPEKKEILLKCSEGRLCCPKGIDNPIQVKKGKPFRKFWDGLVYTRVLLSKFEELGLKGYFEANHRQREYGYTDVT